MGISEKKCVECSAHYKSATDYLSRTTGWRSCSNHMLWLHCECGSVLTIKEGEYDWYQPELLLKKQKIALYQKLKEKDDLPRMKSSAIQLQEMLSKKDPDSKAIEKVIKTEPILLGEVIATANRLKKTYQDETKIENIEHALVYLGFHRLKHLVMVASLKTIQIKTQYFSVENFWDHSFNQAIVAEFLTKKFAPYLNQDEMYLSGFLVNIGKMISAFYFPEQVDRIAKMLNNPKNRYPWDKLEKIHEVDPHYEVGEISCRIWGLPDYVSEICGSHLKTSNNKNKMMTNSDLVSFANIMTNWIQYNLLEVDHKKLRYFGEKLSLSQSDIENLATELSAYVNNSRVTLKSVS